MKYFRQLSKVFCLSVLLSFICLIPQLHGGEGRQENKVSIIDGNGKSMEISLPVNRIIVEYTDNAELVRILNRSDRVVGVAGYDYIFKACKRQFPQFRLLPEVGFPWAMDYEAVLGLSPDLLLTFTPKIQDKQANLPGINVLFLGLYRADLSAVEDSSYVRGVRTLGRILDAEDRAEAYLEWYNRIIETISKRTASLKADQKPRVLISSYPKCSSAGGKYCAFSPIDTLTQASKIAGGKNLVNSLPGIEGVALPVDPEWLIRENPDFILLHTVDNVKEAGYETDNPEWLEKGLGKYMAAPELASLNAIKNKRVFVLDGHFRNDASGGALAAAHLAVLFHPDLFEDLDPEALHMEFLKMQGLDYDLDAHGIFFFPPLERRNNLIGIPNHFQAQKAEK